MKEPSVNEIRELVRKQTGTAATSYKKGESLSYKDASSLIAGVKTSGGYERYKSLAQETKEPEEFSLGKFLTGTLQKGLSGIAQIGGSVAAGVEDVVAAPLEFIMGMPQGTISDQGFLNRWNDSIRRGSAARDDYFAENTAAGGKVAQVAEDLGAATITALPQAWLAIATGGTSLAAQGAARLGAGMAPGVSAGVTNAVKTLAKDPNYWTAFASIAGPSYQQAVDEGADIDRAVFYAVGNGMIGAMVEQGGIQKLPSEMQKGGSAWKVWVDGMVDEGREEVVQGVIERAMQNVAYDRGNLLVSLTDENAIFNPATAAKEFAGGFTVGGILGGGQIGAATIMDGAQRRYIQALQEAETRKKETVTQRQRQEMPGTTQTTEDTPRTQNAAEAAQRAKTAATPTGVTQQAGAAEQMLTPLELDPDQTLEDWSHQYDDPNVREFYLTMYRPGQDKADYDKAFRATYDYGVASVVGSSNGRAIYRQALATIGTSMDNEQAEVAYSTGRAIGKKMARERARTNYATTGGKVTFDGHAITDADTRGLTPMQLDQMAQMVRVANVAGFNLNFTRSTVVNGMLQGPNGQYDPETNTITLDVNAGADTVQEVYRAALGNTMSHELTHFIRVNAPADYAALRDFIAESVLGSNVWEQSIDRHMAAGKDLETAIEETVADGCQMMLKDSTAIETLARENRTLFEKIGDWVRDFAKKIQNAFRNPTDPVARMMQQEAAELQKLWDKGLVNASRNLQSARTQKTAPAASDGTAVRYSDKNGYDAETATIKQQISNSAEMLSKMEPVANMEVPTDFNNKNTAVTWYEKNIRVHEVENKKYGKIRFNEGDLKQGLRYAKTPEERAAIAFLPQVLKKGVEIGEHGDHKAREKSTLTIAAPVVLNGTRGNMAVVINKRGNVYYAHRIVLPDGSSFRFSNKNENTAPGPSKGVAVSGSLAKTTSAVSSGTTVPQTAPPVKRNSDRATVPQRDSRREGEITDQEILLGLEAESMPTNAERVILTTYQQRHEELQAAIERGDQTAAMRAEKQMENIEKGDIVHKLLRRQRAYIDARLGRRQVKNTAQNIRRNYSATASVSDIEEVLSGLGQMMRGGKETAAARRYAAEVASDLIDGARVSDPTMVDDYREVLQDLKGRQLLIAEVDTNDIPDYNEWRKHNFGRLQVRKTKDGEMGNIDTVYAELQDKYGTTMFPEVLAVGDMLMQIAEVSASARVRTTVNPFENFLTEAKEDLTQTLLAEARIMAARGGLQEELAQAYRALETSRRAHENYRRKEEEGTKRIVERERRTQQLEERIARMEERQHKQVQEREQRQIKSRQMERIQGTAKRIRRLLDHPTNDAHVPAGLEAVMKKFTSLFPYPNVAKNTPIDGEKMRDLAAAYRELKEDGVPASIQGLYAEDIPEVIDYLATVCDGRTLRDLEPHRVKAINDIANHMAFLIRNENEVFLDGKKVGLEATADRVILDARAAGEEKTKLQETIEDHQLLEDLESFTMVDNLKPGTVFRKMGGVWREIYQQLMDGQGYYAQLQRRDHAFYQEIMDRYDMWDWKEGEETFTISNELGQKITMTRGEALWLLATWKREQLDTTQQAHHLENGGVIYNTKNKTKGRKTDSTPRKISRLAMRDLARQVEKSKQGAQNFVDEMAAYLTEKGAEGNVASLKLWGFEKFGTGFYFPYTVSSDFTSKAGGKGGKAQPSMIKAASFAKSLVPRAANPLEMQDFFDVWSNHCAGMNTFTAMAVPQDTMNRILQYHSTEESKSVVGALRDGYGENYVKYLNALIRDMNGGMVSDYRGSNLKKLTNMFKKAATGLSLSVVVQQPSSVVRAMNMVSGHYFRVEKHPLKSYQEAMDYSGTAALKEQGGYDTGTTRGGAAYITQQEATVTSWKEAKDYAKRLMKDGATRDEAAYYLAGKADELAWGTLWEAVKRETAALHPELSGEALLRAAGKRMDEVTDRTQVYDSVLSRSGNMRSKSDAMQMATSFMSEPTINFNMLWEAVDEAVRGRAPKKNVLKTMGAILASSIVGAAFKALVTSFRDDDDDEVLAEKYVDKFIGGALDNINPLGWIPLGRDIVSLAQGYDIEASYASVLTDFRDAIDDLDNKNKSTWDKARGMAGAMGNLLGIPMYNLLRDIDTVMNAAEMDYSAPDAMGMRNAIREGLGMDAITVGSAVEQAAKARTDAAKNKALQDVSSLYTDKVEGYVKGGMSRDEATKKAASSTKSACTKVLKPMYQEAKTSTEKQEVASLARRILVGGRQLYKDYDFAKEWKADE